MLLVEKLDAQIIEKLAESGDEPMSITDTRKDWEKHKKDYTKMLTSAMFEQVCKEAAELHKTIVRKTQTD